MSTLGGLTPGSVFANDFRVVRPLAEGGMGAVYVVEQLSTGKRRALKVMYSHFARDAVSHARFIQEARIGADIESDHVVEIVGAGVDRESGTPWLAMELLDGKDLGSLAKERGRLPAPEVLELFEQLCDALGKAHARGVVHRDLKPENLFVATARRRGVPFTLKILDFGIAKVIQENRTAATVSMSIGSPLWMAPEQTNTDAKIRPATDVWALGLIAYRLLTGTVYWNAANATPFNLSALVVEVLALPLEPASARAARTGTAHFLPPGFDAWFGQCVVREPEQRLRDAIAAMEALREVLGAPPGPAAGRASDARVQPSGPAAGRASYAEAPLQTPLGGRSSYADVGQPASVSPQVSGASSSPSEIVPPVSHTAPRLGASRSRLVFAAAGVGAILLAGLAIPLAVREDPPPSASPPHSAPPATTNGSRPASTPSTSPRASVPTVVQPEPGTPSIPTPGREPIPSATAGRAVTVDAGVARPTASAPSRRDRLMPDPWRSGQPQGVGNARQPAPPARVAPAPATAAVAAAPVAAAPPSSGQSPMDQARACLRAGTNDAEANRCVVAALRGRASTEPELRLLAVTYRTMGERTNAVRTMRMYLTRYPQGPMAGSFMQYIDGQ